jgi:hypothetical protein
MDFRQAVCEPTELKTVRLTERARQIHDGPDISPRHLAAAHSQQLTNFPQSNTLKVMVKVMAVEPRAAIGNNAMLTPQLHYQAFVAKLKQYRALTSGEAGLQTHS